VTALIETRGGLDATARRDSLLALIKENPQQPVTTKGAQGLYSVTPWSGIGRNAARRDLRDLAHRGHLSPVTLHGQQAYLLNPKTVDRHPAWGTRRAELALLQAVANEGGEWTPGRAKVVLRRAIGTNIYRSVARRRLEGLHRAGLVELRSERPGHCYYAPLIEGGAS
jgi:ribosomal protein S25